MATLLERISGAIPVGDPSTKISIHGFCAAMNELRRGKLTAGDFTTMFDLTPGQVNTMGVLRDLFVACPQKMEFLRVLKDILLLSEGNYDPKYRTQAWVLSRLQDEVTDHGGTLP